MAVTTELATAKVRMPTQSSSPEGWRHVRLTEVARLESGHTPSKRQPDYWGGAIPWVSLHDTEGLDAWEIQTTSQSITEAGLANSSARLLPQGTVVFSRTATVGKSTVMGRAMATSQDFACYVCGPEVHNFYLALLLRSMRAEWNKLMAGSIHNTVYMPVFKTLSVDLPPHGEQVAIANTIRDADRMIDSLEQLLTKKRQIKQGAMQELFNPDSLRARKVSLEQISGFITKGATPTTYGFGWESDGIVFLRSECVSPGGLDLTQSMFISEKAHTALRRSAVSVGDLLMTITGNVGRVAIATIDCNINQHIARIRISDAEVNPDFVYHQLSRVEVREELESITTGQAYPQLSLRQVRERTVQVPSRAEQDRIAQTLSDMDDEIATLESRLTKARALKQAMAQALLTGRIRLVEPTA